MLSNVESPKLHDLDVHCTLFVLSLIFGLVWFGGGGVYLFLNQFDWLNLKMS